MVFLVPLLVTFGRLQPERAAKIDHNRTGIEELRSQFHRNVRGCSQQDRFHPFDGDATLVAMFQRNRLKVRMARQNPDRFRPAVASEPDNSDRESHNDYLFTLLNKYTILRIFRFARTICPDAMHEYDTALKRILMRPGSALLAALTGCDRLRWLNVELPKVRNLRVDMLGEKPDGELVQIEFQSGNEKGLPFRMGEYLFGIGRMYRRLPRQIVLYVGEGRLRMKHSIEGPDCSFRFHLTDIRDFDGERLLASPNVGDNIIAILTPPGSNRKAVLRTLGRIAKAPVAARDYLLAELFIVAGLRKLGDEVREEAKKMPILTDIMDHDVIGPLLRQGRAEGRVEGRIEGQMEILLLLMKKRFGTVPARIRKRLATLTPDELTAASLRILDAQKPEDLFS